MGISANAVFGAFGGRFGTDARFGVKRSKRETSDGSVIDARLSTPPAGLDIGSMRAAARHGLTVALTTADGAYGRELVRAGIVADYMIGGIMSRDETQLTPPAPPSPELTEALDTINPPAAVDPPATDVPAVADPVPAKTGRNGRKTVTA